MLILRAQAGREWLARRFADAGAEVEVLPVDTRTDSVPDVTSLGRVARAMQEGDDVTILFSSSEAIDALDRQLDTVAGAANGCAVAARWRRIRASLNSCWPLDTRESNWPSRVTKRSSHSFRIGAIPLTAGSRGILPLSTCSADHDPPIAALHPNESPSIEPVAAVANTPAPAAIPEPATPPSAWPWIAAIAIVASLGAAVDAQPQLGAPRKESHGSGELEQATARATETATRADAEARAARERAMVLEARLADEQGQREALEQLYTDLSRGRDEAVLVEVERLVAVASQELSVSGNLNTALAALQTADRRLARSDSARFLPLRRASRATSSA